MLAGEGAIQEVRKAYTKALSTLGFQCMIWHPQSGKPIFDVFNEYTPDVVFCGTWEIDRALFKNLMLRPYVKVILWGANWGSFDNQIDTRTDPVLMASQSNNLEYIEKLAKNNKIQSVFSYYSQKWANITHNKWEDIGLTPIGLPLAADVVSLGLSYPQEELRCDVSFVGGYWPYKAINLNKFLVPLCYPAEGLRVKIFGYGDWPVAQHLGTISDELLPTLFSSSAVNVNVFEPLAQKYGFDVNERCYKILACGGFCVSEYCDSAANDIFTNNEVMFARTPEEFRYNVRYFVNHPEDRLPYIERGIACIKHKHNYFLRLQKLLPAVKLDTPNIMDKLNNIIVGIQNND
jgi:hypothetical protein